MTSTERTPPLPGCEQAYRRAMSAARAEKALEEDSAIQAALVTADVGTDTVLRGRCANAATMAAALLELDARMRAGLPAPVAWSHRTPGLVALPRREVQAREGDSAPPRGSDVTEVPVTTDTGLEQRKFTAGVITARLESAPD